MTTLAPCQCAVRLRIHTRPCVSKASHLPVIAAFHTSPPPVSLVESFTAASLPPCLFLLPSARPPLHSHAHLGVITEIYAAAGWLRGKIDRFLLLRLRERGLLSVARGEGEAISAGI